MLRHNNGKDPSHLFPLTNWPRFRGSLKHGQKEVCSQLFVLLGCSARAIGPEVRTTQKQHSRFQRMDFDPICDFVSMHSGVYLLNSLHGPHTNDVAESFLPTLSSLQVLRHGLDNYYRKNLIYTQLLIQGRGCFR